MCTVPLLLVLCAGDRQLFVMPGPFASRPRLGTRILVQVRCLAPEKKEGKGKRGRGKG